MPMDKIIFSDYEEPAVGADILNDLQDNIEKYVNEKTLISEYSLDEIKIGTWLEKPLYRKVIPLTSSQFGTGTATAPLGINIPHNIPNIDYIVNWSCRWKRTSDGQFRDFPNSSPSNDAWHGHLIPTATNLFFELGTVLVNNLRSDSNLIYAVLEYTKTTDV